MLNYYLNISIINIILIFIMNSLSTEIMNKNAMEQNLKLLGISAIAQFIGYLIFTNCFGDDDLFAAKVSTDI